MGDTRVGRPAEIAGPGLALWEAAREPDVRRTEGLDRGPSRGTAGEAIRDVKRVSEALGPVGFAWGWEVRGERLDTFGLGEDQRQRLVEGNHAPARWAKCQAASASIGTRAAISSALALEALPSRKRFLMPWTMPSIRWLTSPITR